ncbi:hypothetical protein MSAN_01225200 [Mycena sanguinolenta]|uniref:F-box domain-containing protein n=1 Tax=Mycena sanguinolenta TaxID=230812 RepID=A0A8H6YHX2_9AGAR|nr:hypothetical protein MSAN_01225200 [Mycena sanguinolenta]
MTFTGLNTDVLLQILADTDVYTILSISRVNRALHEVTSLRHLWLSVVLDLSHRRLIDAPPAETLSTLTKDELVEVFLQLLIDSFSSLWIACPNNELNFFREVHIYWSQNASPTMSGDLNAGNLILRDRSGTSKLVVLLGTRDRFFYSTHSETVLLLEVDLVTGEADQVSNYASLLRMNRGPRNSAETSSSTAPPPVLC